MTRDKITEMSSYSLFSTLPLELNEFALADYPVRSHGIVRVNQNIDHYKKVKDRKSVV